jgi:hypothetical protein
VTREIVIHGDRCVDRFDSNDTRVGTIDSKQEIDHKKDFLHV